MEQLPKFNYGRVQPVAFDDGMSLYEEVAKIYDSQNKVIEELNKYDPSQYAKASELNQTNSRVTNLENDLNSLESDTVLKSTLLQEPVRTSQNAMSAFASMNYTDDEIESKSILKTSLTQDLGESPDLVMSQKAVTDAIQSANNTTRVVSSFTDNVISSSSWVGNSHYINDLPNFAQTATITLTPETNPIPSALTIKSYDTNNNTIDSKGFSWNGINPISVTLTLPTLSARVIISGQSGSSFVLNISVSYLKIADNTLQQTTGQSTTQAMSQKATTDAIKAVDSEYDLISLDQSNTTTPIDNLYDSYEKNTVYIFNDSSNRSYGCIKLGQYELMGILNLTNEYHTVKIIINENNTITITTTNNYNIIGSFRSGGGAIYNNSYINSIMPRYQSITVGSFSASVALGNLYVWNGSTADSSSYNVMYFPTGINTLNSVGTFLYGWKKANETTIHFITTSNMPAYSGNFSVEVFRQQIIN